MSVEDFVQDYVDYHAWKEGRDPETCRENAHKYAVPLFGENVSRLGWFDWLREERDSSPEEASTNDVRAFLTYLTEEGLSAPTRSQARGAISQWYQVNDMAETNPVEGLDGSWRATTDKEESTGEERVYLSESEVEDMIENVPEPTLRSELIIKLLYHTGARRMELATIELERLDLEEMRVEVYADKTNEWRDVPLRNSLREPLNIWITSYRPSEPGWFDGNPYLFPSLRTRETDADHVSGETVRKTVIEAAENAGLQESYGTDSLGQNQNLITPHTLRHSFAIRAVEEGVPAPLLQEIMGHHSLEVTQEYADIAGEDAVGMFRDYF